MFTFGKWKLLDKKRLHVKYRRSIAEILQLKTPSISPGALISVSKVRLSPDLSYAKVFLSVFPLKDDQEFLNSLNLYASEIRNELGKRVATPTTNCS